MEKKGLKPLGISLIVLLVIAIVIVGFLLFSSHPNSTGNVIAGSSNSNMMTSGNAAPPQKPTMMNFTGMLLSNSPLANYAYLISTNPLSSQAQEAIIGFQLNSTPNPDGSTSYTLTATKQGYVSQAYTVQPGQSLYFIERSLGDDNAADNDDFNLGDDFAVVVDANGYIIQGPSVLSPN
jgi:preprotein translocase subunit SecG